MQSKDGIDVSAGLRTNVSRFADRIGPGAYSRDEVVGVFLSETGRPGGSWIAEAWIPEALFSRLLLLGRAYGLHAIIMIDAAADTHLDATQCETFCDELEFLAELVPQDAALNGVLADVVPLATRASRSAGRQFLVIRPP